jgi:hypothetical protein
LKRLSLPIFLLCFGVFYISLIAGERNLTKKIRIDENGIYAWRRNGNEEFISWYPVKNIRRLDNFTPDDFILLYKKSKGQIGFSELGLDHSAYQLTLSKFNEFKNERVGVSNL